MYTSNQIVCVKDDKRARGSEMIAVLAYQGENAKVAIKKPDCQTFLLKIIITEYVSRNFLNEKYIEEVKKHYLYLDVPQALSRCFEN